MIDIGASLAFFVGVLIAFMLLFSTASTVHYVQGLSQPQKTITAETVTNNKCKCVEE